MAYKNPDGLYLKYGTEKVVPNRAGEFVTTGALRTIELKIDLTTLTQAEVIQSDVTFFPKMRIEEIEVVTHTAAVTGVAIDVGLVRTSDRTTEIDFDGLLAAFPIASMNAAGEKTILTNGSTFAGALIGTTIANPGHITASATTATAFTAGIVYIRIKYYAFS